jgi:hypothetical protein
VNLIKYKNEFANFVFQTEIDGTSRTSGIPLNRRYGKAGLGLQGHSAVHRRKQIFLKKAAGYLPGKYGQIGHEPRPV